MSKLYISIDVEGNEGAADDAVTSETLVEVADALIFWSKLEEPKPRSVTLQPKKGPSASICIGMVKR